MWSPVDNVTCNSRVFWMFSWAMKRRRRGSLRKQNVRHWIDQRVAEEESCLTEYVHLHVIIVIAVNDILLRNK